MKKYMAIFTAVLAFSACKKDDDDIITPPPVNEEEVITKLQLTFTDNVSGETFVWVQSDPDGDGGDDPVQSVDTLPANGSFTMEVRLFNETENPVEEMTSEIEEEDEEHQFFFELNSGAFMNIQYNDADGNGNPIGLSNNATTGEAENVQLTVTLRHEPDKSADGVSDGNIGNAGGETDLEVTFAGVIE